MAAAHERRTWLDVCGEFGRRHGVNDDTLEALMAFRSPQPRGGPPPPPEAPFDGTFEALEREAVPPDPDAIARQLTAEVNPAQAGVFARRTVAVASILADLGSPDARVLRVGFLVRLAGIHGAGLPRARRVRALADYYYSLAARLRHGWGPDSGRHLEEMVSEIRWSSVEPGIEHATLDGLAEGAPVHANLLRIEPRRARITVDDLTDATTGGTPLAFVVATRAVAAVSGGYFLYSEDDIEPPSRRHDPVGLLMEDGVVLSPPTFSRGSLLIGPAGDVEIRVVSLRDVPIRIDGRPVEPSVVWNRATARVGPDEDSVAVVGPAVVAVGRSLPVPLNGFVATGVDDGGPAFEVGAAVSYGPPRMASGRPAVAAVAGGPTIVREGRAVLDMRAEDFWGSAPPITFSQDETGDQNLLARLAVGIDASRRLFLAAVDGRNVERALGMTLGDVSRLMILLGCRDAINLDGGSSKRMLVAGRIVDLPSTEIIAGEAGLERVRPVHTAILFQPSG